MGDLVLRGGNGREGKGEREWKLRKDGRGEIVQF